MTKYSNPSNVKKSAPMCCHGHSGAGVGWSGCLGSCGWWHWHVGHASTIFLISSLIQANIHIVLHGTGTWWFPCVLRVWLVVFSPFPKVGWWELLPWGWVHLLQSWHHGGCGKGVVLWVCPWYPQAILPLLCQQECTGAGHLGLSSGTPVSSLGDVDMVYGYVKCYFWTKQWWVPWQGISN